MTVYSCPIPDVLPVATRGHYIPQQPEPTTAELLSRITRHLLCSTGEFSYKWEMARHHCYVQVSGLLENARHQEHMEEQRHNLSLLSK